MKKIRLFVDFESYSEVDLSVVGLDLYVKHPSTEITMMGYAYNDDPVKLWEPHTGAPFPIPDSDLYSPDIEKVAWNVAFERQMFRHKLLKNIPLEQWEDVMVHARYASLPGGLDDCGDILGIDFQKLDLRMNITPKKSIKYTRYFGMPQRVRKSKCPCSKCAKEREEWKQEALNKMAKDAAKISTRKKPRKPKKVQLILPGWHDGVRLNWNTSPEEWAEFGKYCMRDVEAEREILLTKLNKFVLPETEKKGWVLDQIINERGMPVNVLAAANGLYIANKAKAEISQKIIQITGIENPNSVQQMMGWLVPRGYPYASLGKDFVKKALNGPLDSDAIEVLNLRQQGSRTAYKKLEVIMSEMGSDSRMRYSFSYLGAARSGRWSSHGAQLHNLPRPIKELDGRIEEAVHLMEFGNYEEIKSRFSANPLDIVGSCIRPVFQAPSGYHFVVGDLNAIENRGLGWVAWLAANRAEGADKILQVFRDGLDPYKAFAVYMFGKPYEEITKEERQIAKAPVLGCGYQLSGGGYAKDKDGNDIRTGLFGYAENMGIDIPMKDCAKYVKLFRDTYPEVKKLWFALESAAMQAINSYISRNIKVGPVSFDYADKVLRIVLPSGRALHYLNARIERREVNWETDEPQYKDTIVYDGMMHVGKGEKQITAWGPTTTYGGKLTENVVQAICRDILLYAMFLAEEMGFKIVGHVHDEIITLVKNGSKLGLKQLLECMTTAVNWALDFPLGADGYEGIYYRKG